VKIEFMPVYDRRGDLSSIKCGGDDGCGAHVADAHQHREWHQKIAPPILQIPEVDPGQPELPMPGPTILGRYDG